tara:strand:- start:982 stop:1674 length:693 start_codon:yes stop_codon:yes gene_type:complete
MVEETTTNTQETAATDQGVTAPQPTVETSGFTQDEVDKLISQRVSRERAKLEKKFADVDVDKYRTLVEAEESRLQEEAKKRGEFDQVIKEQAEKYNAKINQYQQELTSIKVDGALLQAASKAKAINPDQVVQLLKGQLKLNESGTVDVVDNTTGQVRYNDKGDPVEVETLVTEFLQSNPHFVSAGPQGSGANGGVGNVAPVEELDISKLNMNKAEDREKYKAWKKQTYGV